jgi:hypothetical protein
MSQSSEAKPEERWRLIAFAEAPRLRLLGFTDAQIERFAKDIVNGGPYASMEEEIKAVRARYANVSDPNQIK